MNIKAFTLVELIAIIAILAAIFLVSFPIFSNMLKNQDESSYEIMVEDLCLAGETYIYSNLNRFSDLSVIGSEISIKISDLIKANLVDKNKTNPKTDKKVSDGELTFTVLENKSLDCKYKDR